MTSVLTEEQRRARVLAVAVLLARLADATVVRQAVDTAMATVAAENLADDRRVLALAWQNAEKAARNQPDDRSRSLLARLGPGPPDIAPDDPDARTGLLFACCHSALPEAARIALTLSLFSGLTAPQLARAFGAPEATMTRRLEQAELRLRDQVLPRPPGSAPVADSLRGALGVLMLIFDDGYVHPQHDTNVVDLPAEAIRLARAVVGLFPGDPEARALLALMLIARARRDVHLAPDGSVVPIQLQDRSRWRHEEIDEGLFHLRSSVRQDRPGPYQLRASIQAVHVDAADAADTDWSRILSLYDQLLRVAPSDDVALDRVNALAEVRGPQVALREVERLGLDSHLSHATRADLLERVGRHEEADRAWTAAVARTQGAHEHARLRDRGAP